MPFDRIAAEQYVHEFWSTPCDDGKIYSYIKGIVDVPTERKKLEKQGKLPGTGWKAALLPAVEGGVVVRGKERGCFIRTNPQGEEILAPVEVPTEWAGKWDIVPFYEVAGAHDGLVDCAHYVSRVLTRGKVEVNQPGVPGLVQVLRNRQDTHTLGLEVPLAAGDRIMATGVMQFGDVIAYFHTDPKTNQRGYAHSAVYSGKDPSRKLHRLSCHTVARFDGFPDGATWNITDDADWRFTLIHFIDKDETFPNIPQPLRLQVTRGTVDEVYDFRPNGKVARGRVTGGAVRSFGSLPGDNGYWFVRGFSAFVFWPRTAEVAKIGLGNVLAGEFLSMTVDDVAVQFSIL